MGRTYLLFVAAIASSAVAGCSLSSEAELEQARADAQQAKAEVAALHARLSALESQATPAPAAAGPSTNTNSVARLPVPPRSVGPQPGSVRLNVFGQNYLSSTGPWIYVHGRLVRDLGTYQGVDPGLLTLEPGDYTVEVVAAGVPRADSYPVIPFYLTAVGQRAKVEAGGSVQLDFDLQHLASPQQEFGNGGGALAFPSGSNARGWAQFWQNKAEEKLKLYESDAVVAALKQLDAQLGTQRPERRVAWLNIPESYGGRREVNAAQVRLIVAWLKFTYWGGWPADFTYRTDIRYEGDPEAELQAIRFTDQLVKRHREQIEQLNSAARKLEMGRD